MRKRDKFEEKRIGVQLTDINEAPRRPLAELPRLVSKAHLNYAWKSYFEHDPN